jgi:hypothetical protein
MYDTTIAAKLLGQLKSFLGRISPHFRRPVARFIGDMMYGIMAEKDVKLSSIVRALKEGITPKKVEDRLSRMLSSKGLERDLHDAIAEEGARMSFRIHDVPEFHFYSIADGASDILKGRGGRWRGFDPAETEKEREASLFAFFGLNTG